ncbi:SAM-dependent methyltransferase [Actinomadura barringtoniae]|uniref:SAM-dependent methyltransferase n=1 Tax=Actinomadura barringtoniae TaxID=1427535 RepID=A0A939P8A7_9ACTN|nr:SAM-dependent methyltransferase [Actinomadura barringtoniae]MBO2447716.1 SAM-dependent methyltransferase [Actinomadura barringtoniae]
MEKSRTRTSNVDPNVPSSGRIYDFLLNGRDHYPADKAAARKVLERVPEAHYMAHANRVFLQRAAGRIARAGVRQFIDIGSGIPTAWNTHEVVQVVDPQARVVYVDNDPVVLEMSQEILSRNGESNAVYVDADVREPDSILTNPAVRDLIDFDQPVGYMHIAIWHFAADEYDPWGLVTRYLDAVPSGSYLALSHVTSDDQKPDKVQRFKDVYANTPSGVHFRTREEINRFFTGLEFLPPYEGAEPALSFVDKWGSKNPNVVDPSHTWLPCGVARKP